GAVRSMMSERILSELGMGLDWAVKRHQAIANNIANIDTPGYKRQDVAFPEVLAQAVKSEGSKLTLRRTNPRHLPPPPTGSLSVTVERGTSLRNDGNNVDAEVETAELAKNAMYYDSLIDRAGGYLRSLRLVISEGRR
ncbi:MAG: flagellar basal body rod protein FlgB, partial [bacterium]